MRGLGFGFSNPVGKGGVFGVCLFGLRWCRWFGEDWVGGLDQGLEGEVMLMSV